ncbi:hypothetical protein CLOM_g17157 [Closterium sp. NIES-68]|nr:hypothetical protein CLOM_g17157 [Closterium sp. NIES-68]
MAAVEEPVQANGGAAPEDPAINGEVQARDWGTAEEQAARGRAPIKKEYLMPPGGRKGLAAAGETGKAGEAKEGGEGQGGEGGKGKAEKGKAEQRLSHRALKKQRKQALATQPCNTVARTGDPASCPFGDTCRFSHDLEIIRAQLPPTLEGTCPFAALRRPCPFGLACRFRDEKHGKIPGSGADGAEGGEAGGGKGKGEGEGAGKKGEDAEGGEGKEVGEKGGEKGSEVRYPGEVNMLDKGLQSKLWKRQVDMPRAVDALQRIGWTRKVKPRGEASLMPDLDENAEGEEGEEGEEAEGGMGEVDREGRRKGALAAAATAAEETAAAVATAAKGAAVAAGGAAAAAAAGAAAEVVKEGIGAIGKEQETDKEAKVGDDKELRLPSREKKPVDFKGKLIVAPLTTVGNLPFRRVCCSFGADVTIGEMAMCANLLQGQASEWALLRRHESEKCFGVQLCGPHPDMVAKAAELVAENCQVDFVDLNVGCPIDIVVNKGSGSSLLRKPQRLEQVVRAASLAIDVPLTVKMRTGYAEGHNVAHRYIPHLLDWGATAVTLHGRTRQQRYSRLADWEYIGECASVKPAGLQFIGNGDVLAYTDWNQHTANGSATAVDSCMLARGALIKPWLLTEITEQRHWDISATERLDMLRSFTRYGLLHWGSDSRGVETTRRFLLEWLSYLHRYVPVGLLDMVPQRINWRPPAFYGRNDLETLFGSDQPQDWVKISEMLLGPPPPSFRFVPKHKSNSYDAAENG